ncbi:N-hydroxyarylamine O-acetyltransferase [Cytospora mali]|uniref:N-hydroxyarylamine O-acetyltransferase n=1 Tax=Cytospora mali TaxID=578113 RepID=A0A194VBZ3_CYTMA|nr:N-hydroxyarylamine O-acetyltransferase [Valsa mali var. pyri (nom. inval.)]
MAGHSMPDLCALQQTPLSSVYTPSQILTYLHHISFPLPLSFPRNADALILLHRLQICTTPYENLSLHYHHRHMNDIDPHALFEKFVSPRGRGGYCFETSIFWLNILRGLGFTAYHSQASIRLRDGPVPKGDFVGPRHVVTIVEFADGSRWVTDVGFGGDGMTAPLPLIDAPEDGKYPVHRNLGTQEVRVTRGSLPGTFARGGQGNQVWFYEYRNRPGEEWSRYYAFGDHEATSWDLECANYWVSSHPESFQRKQILAVKFLRDTSQRAQKDSVGVEGGVDEDGVDDETIPAVEILGKIMLAGATVKRNMGSKTEQVKICRTEEERVQALKDYFGITLSGEEKDGIKGFETALQ